MQVTRTHVARRAKAQPKSVPTMIRMPPEVRAQLEEVARIEDRTMSKVAVRCIQEGLKARAA
jgi:predicted transcriptional regulator